MTKVTRGLFITLEGGEGAGKTTAQKFIHHWLVERGREVVLTREPGGTALAERIRELLLDRRGDMGAMTELLLMFAARSDNLDAMIEPALASGKDILCDRFTDASRAYQGGGRELGLSAVDALANLVHPNINPDLTLLMDVPVDLGMDRVHQRGTKLNRMEMAQRDFYGRVRSAYLELAKNEPDRFVVIDATASIEGVQQQIATALEQLPLEPRL